MIMIVLLLAVMAEYGSDMAGGVDTGSFGINERNCVLRRWESEKLK